MIQRTDYIEKLRPYFGTSYVKVLTGIKGCGKTTILKQVEEEIRTSGVSFFNIISYDFRDPANIDLLEVGALTKEVSRKSKEMNGKSYMFFDEIQRVKGWEKLLGNIRDKYDCDIYISGESGRYLYEALYEEIGEKCIEIPVYPFSFKEFKAAYSEFDKGLTDTQLLDKYTKFGGMPYLYQIKYDLELVRQYILDYCDATRFMDVIKRASIRDVEYLQMFGEYVISHVGESFSANYLVRYFKENGKKVSTDTVLSYINSCSETGIIYQLKHRDVYRDFLVRAAEKYYVPDLGVREVLFGANKYENQQILENIVLNELIIRGYQVSVGRIHSNDVDFMAIKDDVKIYIQVAPRLSEEEGIVHAFEAYGDIKDNNAKYVVSLDEHNMSTDTVKNVNIIDFLLKDEW